ncbi:MAG: hypothetical protein K2X93_27940, partial [Candidatus Obscuribacterales bacterium]|nr:hypothetical protein [Candidatus Obscuribacterales bacterium]
IVRPTKGPLAIRVPPQNSSGRGSLLNSTELSSSISASAAGKRQGAASGNDGKNRIKSKTSAVSRELQEQAVATPATYEPNYGQTKKRKF